MARLINTLFIKSNAELTARAVEVYLAGGSIADAAKVAGVTRQSMWATLKRRGVQMRPQLRYGPENHFYRDGSDADPRKARARKRINKLRRFGRITPKPCERCGATADTSEAHHADYDRPLDVLWLCRPCHRAEHAA